MKHLFTLVMLGLFGQVSNAQYISEIDADQPSTDNMEFVELTGTPGAAMTGLSLAFVNGSNDETNNCIDLSGETFPADGVFVVGSATVPNVDLVVWTSNGMQNGVEAVVLFMGSCTSNPNGTPCGSITGTILSSVIYDTNDADDSGLINCLGGMQINEGAANNSESIQIDAMGAVTIAAPTPGVGDSTPPPPPPVDPIPTMGQWALFILALLMSSLGVVFLYNERKGLWTYRLFI